jgi:putative transposase
MLVDDHLFYKRRLPHLYSQDSAVFITWRLNHDLPNSMKDFLYNRTKTFENSILTENEQRKKIRTYNFQKQQFDWLDTQLGINTDFPETLNQPDIADIVYQSLHYHNDTKYRLHAFCIMPNHVHVLITPISEGHDWSKILASITKSWKGFSARRINLILNQRGAFWSRESYDHMVRDENEFYRIVNYILKNPVKAKRVKEWQEWKYTWVEEELKENMLIE